MKNSIILADNYFHGLLGIMVKNNQVALLNYNDTSNSTEFNLFSRHKIPKNEKGKWYYKKVMGSRYKEKALQLVLINDEIKLSHPLFDIPILDFKETELGKHGISIHKYNDNAFKLFLRGEINFEVFKSEIKQISNIIISSIENDKSYAFVSGREKISKFLKIIYKDNKELYSSIEPHDLIRFIVEEFIPFDFNMNYLYWREREEYDKKYNNKVGPIGYLSIGRINRFLLPEHPIKSTKTNKVFNKINEGNHGEYYSELFDDVCRYILVKVNEIYSFLHLSRTNNEIIAQNSYKFNQLQKCNLKKVINTNYSVDTYNIVQLNLSKMIGKFPKLNSLEDTLRIKEKKHKEISRFREVIRHIHNDITTGEFNISKRIEKEVNLSLKDMNRGETLSEVSKWCTYLSVPITIIETAAGIPPLLGLLTGTAGTSTTIKSNQLLKKSSWLTLYN